MLKSIQHPASISIKFELCNEENIPDRSDCYFQLDFDCTEQVNEGSGIRIYIYVRNKVYMFVGQVCGVKQGESGYKVSVKFPDYREEYKVRLIEQICHIEHYRTSALEQEGRKLTGQEAAEEWISKFARTFPGQN